jgi:hypothetical protein
VDKKTEIKLREQGPQREIFCLVRRKWLVLSPEEWVRQQVIKWLVEEKGFVLSRFFLEYPLKYSDRNKRADAVYFDQAGKPWLVIELKAAEVKLDQSVIDQVAVYNTQIKAPLLLVSNGAGFMLVKFEENNTWTFLKDFPDQAV